MRDSMALYLAAVLASSAGSWTVRLLLPPPSLLLQLLL
jgi:hypothetical protein